MLVLLVGRVSVVQNQHRLKLTASLAESDLGGCQLLIVLLAQVCILLLDDGVEVELDQTLHEEDQHHLLLN